MSDSRNSFECEKGGNPTPPCYEIYSSKDQKNIVFDKKTSEAFTEISSVRDSPSQVMKVWTAYKRLHFDSQMSNHSIKPGTSSAGECSTSSMYTNQNNYEHHTSRESISNNVVAVAKGKSKCGRLLSSPKKENVEIISIAIKDFNVPSGSEIHVCKTCKLKFNDKNYFLQHLETHKMHEDTGNSFKFGIERSSKNLIKRHTSKLEEPVPDNSFINLNFSVNNSLLENNHILPTCQNSEIRYTPPYFLQNKPVRENNLKTYSMCESRAIYGKLLDGTPYKRICDEAFGIPDFKGAADDCWREIHACNCIFCIHYKFMQ